MFICKVMINGEIHHEKEYKSLRDICNELNLSYQQVADYSSKRVKRRQTNNFIFHPVVSIDKIKNEK